MKLLAIETSTESCSVALLNQGEVVEEYQTAPRQHAELTLGMVERLLSGAGLAVGQLDAVAFGRGPGSFTGLRIGCGVVQGIAFAADLPVVPVSTLAAMAQGAVRQWQREKIVPAIDARMEEVYAAAYQVDEDGLVRLVTEECVCRPEQLTPLEGAGWFGVGSGWQSYGEVLAAALGDALEGWEADFYPHARDVALLAAAAYEKGLTVPAEQALPVYLRDQVIQSRRSAS
jgi:tRNA threonylcarbamoyladenosine biosynthesis protein TsaB